MAMSLLKPGMWSHTTWPLTLTSDVDEFGIKYFYKDDANHLLSNLQDKYSITIDWSADMYLEHSINWQYGKFPCMITYPRL